MSDRIDCNRLPLKGIDMDSQSIPWKGHIPIDLVYEILLRLPPKAIGRCMCTCKKWFSLQAIVKSPKFITTHLNLIKLEDPGVLVVEQGRYSLFSESDTALIKQESGRIPFPVVESEFYMLGSCRGLVLVRLKVERGCLVLLWNPLLEKFKVIDTIIIEGPKSDKYSWLCVFALGFHEATNDYRVVRINRTPSEYDDVYSFFPEVDVYSFNEDSWHPVNGRLPNGNILPTIACSKDLPVYINGLVHWLGMYRDDENAPWDENDDWFPMQEEDNDRFVILSFDFDTEVFKVIELHTRYSRYDHESYIVGLQEWNGKLALFAKDYYESGYSTVVMMNYAAVESWTYIGFLFKHKRDVVWPVDCVMPLVCTKKGNCVFKHPWVKKLDMLMYLNAKEDKVYEVEIVSRYACPVITDFVGSLVLLDVENQGLGDHGTSSGYRLILL